MSSSTDFATLALQLQTSDFNKKLDESSYRLESFGGLAKKTVTSVAGFLAASKTIDVMHKAVAGFAADDAAIDGLSAALKNNGYEARSLTEKYDSFAQATSMIVKQTDNQIISAMTAGVNLGLMGDKMDDVAISAAGLAKRYEMDLGSAMQLLGRAQKGHTETLARYGIVLDDNMSKEEKFAALMKMGADSFAQATAETKTLYGQMEMTSKMYGELGDSVGKAIAQDALFIEGLTFVKDNLIGVKEWIDKLSPGYKTFAVRMTAIVVVAAAFKSALTATQIVLAAKKLLLEKTTAAVNGETSALAKNTAAQLANNAARMSGGTGRRISMLDVSDNLFNKSERYMYSGNAYGNRAQYEDASRQLRMRSYFRMGTEMSPIPMSNLAGNLSSVKSVGSANPGFISKGAGAIASYLLPEAIAKSTLALTPLNVALGTVAGALGTVAAGAAVAWTGWKIGDKISEITGLKDALTDFYQDTFFSHINEGIRGIKLDSQIKSMQEKAEQKKAQESEAEKERLEKYEFRLKKEETQREKNIKLQEEENEYWRVRDDLTLKHMSASERITFLEEKRADILRKVASGEMSFHQGNTEEIKLRADEIADLKQIKELRNSIEDKIFETQLKQEKSESKQLEMLIKKRNEFEKLAAAERDYDKKIKFLNQADSYNNRAVDLQNAMTERAKPRYETTVADALVQGSSEAFKWENRRDSNNDERKNIKLIADHTKESIKIQQDISNALQKSLNNSTGINVNTSI